MSLTRSDVETKLERTISYHEEGFNGWFLIEYTMVNNGGRTELSEVAEACNIVCSLDPYFQPYNHELDKLVEEYEAFIKEHDKEALRVLRTIERYDIAISNCFDSYPPTEIINDGSTDDIVDADFNEEHLGV